MTRGFFRPSGKLFLSVLMALGVTCFVAPAFAQQQQSNVAAGCNQTVWTALTAKAEAQEAYDVAVTRQMIIKPDSVLDVTCFDKAAGVSASQGGAIFSGDFTPDLTNVVPGTTPTTAYSCTAIGDLWNQIALGGVNIGAPYATFNDLLSGTPPPNGGDGFNGAWSTAQTAHVFDNLKNAVAALPPKPQIMDFSAAKSSCDVLRIANIISDNCPSSPPQTQ